MENCFLRLNIFPSGDEGMLEFSISEFRTQNQKLRFYAQILQWSAVRRFKVCDGPLLLGFMSCFHLYCKDLESLSNVYVFSCHSAFLS